MHAHSRREGRRCDAVTYKRSAAFRVDHGKHSVPKSVQFYTHIRYVSYRRTNI